MAEIHITIPKALSFIGNVVKNWTEFEDDFRTYWKAQLKKKDKDEVATALLWFAGEEARKRENRFVYLKEVKEGDNIELLPKTETTQKH